jgi:uncharacterized membrane protein
MLNNTSRAMRGTGRSVMRFVKIALGMFAVIACLLGCVWILQGVNILPGSFMTGDIRWAYRGAVVAIVGAAVLYWVLRTPGLWRGVLGAVGLFIALQGCVFALQGINVLPGSAMTGDIRWTYRGIVIAMIGIALFLWSRRKPKLAL